MVMPQLESLAKSMPNTPVNPNSKFCAPALTPDVCGARLLNRDGADQRGDQVSRDIVWRLKRLDDDRLFPGALSGVLPSVEPHSSALLSPAAGLLGTTHLA